MLFSSEVPTDMLSDEMMNLCHPPGLLVEICIDTSFHRYAMTCRIYKTISPFCSEGYSGRRV